MSVHNVLVEYVLGLSGDELEFLDSRLSRRYSGDLAEVLNFLEKNQKVDYELSKAKTADELYDTVDSMHLYIRKEVDRRAARK